MVIPSNRYTNIKNIYYKPQRRIETRINSNVPIFVSIIDYTVFSFEYLFFFLSIYVSKFLVQLYWAELYC